jgi:hypothetical protein
METIWGRKSLELDFNGLAERLAGYNRITLDLGTGDGRYVHTLADRFRDRFFIGVDSCRENLHEHSQAKLANMLFVIARAQHLPHELNGLVSHITINFPWGSLLESLLDADVTLMKRLESIAGSHPTIEIRLNGGALAEAGFSLEPGAQQICDNLIRAGWHIHSPMLMEPRALRGFPSTWARRLAHGRDPRAVIMSGHLVYRMQSIERETIHVW